MIGDKFFANIFYIWTAFQYVLFFGIGFAIRMGSLKKIQDLSAIVWLMLDLLIFAIKIIMDPKGIVGVAYNSVLNIVGAIAVFIVLQKIASQINWKKKYVLFLSKYTMPMYLFHQQIVYIVIIVLNGKVSPYVNAIINFVVAFLFSFFISLLLSHFKVTRWLLGQKEIYNYKI